MPREGEGFPGETQVIFLAAIQIVNFPLLPVPDSFRVPVTQAELATATSLHR